MGLARWTTAAVAIACAATLAATTYAGAAPLDGTDSVDDTGTPTTSAIDDTDPATSFDDTGTPETSAIDDTDPAASAIDDTGAPARSAVNGTTGAQQGIDLDRPVSARELVQVTDFLMFQASMKDFQHIRRQRLLPGQLTWKTSACNTALRDSVSGFQEACERREFGYHNFDRQGRFDDGLRERVDKRFKRELREQCAGEDFVGRSVCERKADLYFGSVGP